MMRLTGAPLSGLRRVVALESAMALLAVAAVAIGIGFGVSAMYATTQLAHPLVAPDAAYYLLTTAGIAVSLGIIAAHSRWCAASPAPRWPETNDLPENLLTTAPRCPAAATAHLSGQDRP
jgi:hypothetical protein